MKTSQLIRFLLPVMLVLIAGILLIIFLVPGISALNPDQRPTGQVGYGSDTVRALIVQILDEGQITINDRPQNYTIFQVRVLEGPYEGQFLEIEYGLQQLRPANSNFKTGQEVLIAIGERPDGTLSAFFTDFIRTGPIIQLFILFVIVSMLISGWKGLRGLVGILFSLGIIIFFVIPQILAGRNPVFISIAGSFIFLSISLYLVYGWNQKTHAAVVGVLISLIITSAISAFFINYTLLDGFGDENAMFLVQMTAQPIDMRGLLLGGMIIGALGVLDDLVISQSSAVFELHAANPNLTRGLLYKRAMNIGRDHVAATVNTLVLAYAGAALPMLLLFSLNSQDLGLLININFIAEEIVRTLVGSLGLFASVPITTGLASLLAASQDRLGNLRPLLGPENSAEGHSHSHGGGLED